MSMSRLTPREREIADLIKLGANDTDIGKHLGVTPQTVGIHRQRIKNKLQTSTTPRLVALLNQQEIHVLKHRIALLEARVDRQRRRPAKQDA